MSQTAILLITLAGSIITTMILTPWLLSMSHKYKLTDETHDCHQFNIPRIGGMVFAPAILIGLSISIMLHMIDGSISNTLKPSSFLVIIGMTLVYLLGIIDDLFGMRKWQRNLVIVACAMVFPLIGLYINNLYGLLGIHGIGYAEGFVITTAVNILIVKGLEGMNNIDGLASAISIIVLLALGLAFFSTGRQSYATVAFSMVGTMLVFLYYNLFGDERIDTKTYMGHAGHLIVGYSIVYLSLKYAMDNPRVMDDHADALLLPFSLLVLPVLEYLRVLAKSSWLGLTRSERIGCYLWHILRNKGFSQLRVTAIIATEELIIIAFNMLLHHVCQADLTWIVLTDLAVYLLLQLVTSRTMKAPRHSETPAVDFNGFRGERGLVSIIMPTWNSSRFVWESIDSILAQTYRNWELIITDDCSTDDTMQILQEYARRDPRITVLKNDRNSGPGVTRNNSLATARGQYIAFCDSDDRWMPGKLDKQLAFMREKDVALCFSPYYSCDENSQFLGYISAPSHTSLFQMMCDNKIGFLTCIYDTDVFGKRPMPAQRKRQDYGLLLQLLKICGNAYSVQQPLAYYRIHPDSQSANKISLLKYNAQTYTDTFGWPRAASYAFLFTIFLPSYFLKRLRNILINVVRAA